MFNELIPGIYTVDHQVADGKNAIFLGERGALVVDVCLTVEEAGATADFVREQGHKPNRVLLTHGHSDHVLGGAPFREAEVFAHVKTPATIRRHLKGFAALKGLDYEQVLAQALWPTIMFNDWLVIDLGDWQLQVFPTPGHSDDSVSIYVPDERLLIAADTLVTGIVPVVVDGDSRVLDASLAQLLTLDVEIAVVGHGPVIRGADHFREQIAWTRAYLSAVRAAVQTALEDGLSDPDAIADRASYDEFIGERLPKDRYNMPKRHRDTVMKIIAEEKEN